VDLPQVEIDAIESFVAQVIGYTADPPPSDRSAAEQALRLVQREHELMATAQRMLLKPVVAPVAVSATDLPNEGFERQERLQRLQSLEQLVTVKDAMVRAVLSEVSTKEHQHIEQAVYARRAHAFATTLHSKANEEVAQWASLADEYTQRLDGMQAVLTASQQEAEQLRAQNEALREQNEQLRSHCTELRALVAPGVGVGV